MKKIIPGVIAMLIFISAALTSCVVRYPEGRRWNRYDDERYERRNSHRWPHDGDYRGYNHHNDRNDDRRDRD